MLPSPSLTEAVEVKNDTEGMTGGMIMGGGGGGKNGGGVVAGGEATGVMMAAGR